MLRSSLRIPLSVSVLITLLFGFAALLSAAFGFTELRMLARFLKDRAAIRKALFAETNGSTPHDDRTAPSVTIQIPLYNERTAAERIVRAAGGQDYPSDRFDVQVLDDSTDETSAIVARVTDDLSGEGVRIEHLRREHRHGYKAGALAEGLRRSDADFVAVFDADFVPEPGFLRAVLQERRPFEDERVAFAQARWAWGASELRGWLERALAVLLERHFLVQKPVRAHVGNVTTFNGSGGVWRRRAIDEAGGWASDTLTEDLDLSYRCALGGWRGRYLQDVEVLNELPGHMRAFKLQQRRWAKGTAQCLRKLAGRLMGSAHRIEDRWEELILLAGYAIHPIALACLLLWPWAVLYVDRTTFWIMQGFVAVGILAAGVSLAVTVHERDRRWSVAGIGQVITGLIIGVGLLVNNTIGHVQGLVEFGGEFLRTPKRVTEDARKDGAERSYSLPLHASFFGELAAIAYCAWGAWFLLENGEPFWAIAMVSWGACLLLVVLLQLARPAR